MAAGISHHMMYMYICTVKNGHVHRLNCKLYITDCTNICQEHIFSNRCCNLMSVQFLIDIIHMHCISYEDLRHAVPVVHTCMQY